MTMFQREMILVAFKLVRGQNQSTTPFPPIRSGRFLNIVVHDEKENVPVTAGFATPSFSRGFQSKADPENMYKDILEEAIDFYRLNSFCKTFEAKGPADRTLIYFQLHIGDTLSRIPSNAQSAEEALNALKNSPVGDHNEAPIPGDRGFPLPSFPVPQCPTEAANLRAYLTDARSELIVRLVQRVFDVDYSALNCKQNPWWIAFGKRRFLNKSLCPS